jgi:DNA-directed RNA polymerase specialized sigma24 family protein
METFSTRYLQKEYDMAKAEEFIKEFKNFAIHFSLKKYGSILHDHHELISCSLEGLLRSFLDLPLNVHNKKSFILTIVNRTIIEHLRYLNLKKYTSTIKFIPYYYIDFQSFACDKLDEIDIKLILKLIENKPIKIRKIFQLYYEGFNFSQIAKILNYKDKCGPLQTFDRHSKKIRALL